MHVFLFSTLWKNLMLPFSQKKIVSFLFYFFLSGLHFLVSSLKYSLYLPRALFPQWKWNKSWSRRSSGFLEGFPCLPHSGSVHLKVVHGDRGPSDMGMFSTAKKTQEGGKLCAGIIHCTRLAASSSRTAALRRLPRGKGERWLIHRMRHLCLQATEQPGWAGTNLVWY